MTQAHINRQLSFLPATFLSLILLFITATANGVCSEPLMDVYKQSMRYYKNGDIDHAFLNLDRFFDTHHFTEYKPAITNSLYAEILNDYAFFTQTYYERQVKFLCREINDESIRSLFILRSSLMDNAKDVLEYVIQIQPNRGIAYLNFADTLYELDWDDSANDYYAKYYQFMQLKGQITKIPPRLTDESIRVKHYQCKQ